MTCLRITSAPRILRGGFCRDAQSLLRGGFTLIELSIVLVIIGLIVGGVLAGQDLIRAAAERAQVSQIEKYNQATNTFRDKYGALPGDMNGQTARQFGFTPRGANPGQGDGNGILEGNNGNTSTGNLGYILDGGETGLFWVDLTYANGIQLNLIDGQFNTATATPIGGAVSGTALASYYPQAKIGQSNYIYVASAGVGQSASTNYFGIAAIYRSNNAVFSAPGLTVKQAYDIDQKIDDGLPQTGNVTAMYLNNAGGYPWQAWSSGSGSTPAANPYTSAAAGSATSCFDNSSAASGTPGIAGTQQHYSNEISNGSNVNCALSFRFQ